MRTTTSLPLMFAAATLAGCTNGDTITVGPGATFTAGPHSTLASVPLARSLAPARAVPSPAVEGR